MSPLSSILLIVVAVFALAVVGLVIWTQRLARQAERLVPMAGKLHPVRGGAIHYIETGPTDAPTIVLIHGIAAQLQHFTYALAPLISDTFRVIALDRPGCGYSRRDGEGQANLREQARMIGEFLDAHCSEAPIVVGHSLGGAVALAIALDRPDKVAALALLCPATQEQSEPPKVFKGLQIKSPLLRRMIGHTLAAPLASRTTEVVLREVFRPEPWPDDFLLKAGGALGLRPKAFVTATEELAMMKTAMPIQVARYEAELKVSGGVLFGAVDAVLPPATHGRPMEAFGLSYEELPGRGHMIPITVPEECASFIRRISAEFQRLGP